uniref:Uncharacterized protein n=1 Tax=viral metagenome TaxID=1070528 RepID=A0A6M3LAM6_9ZZZZ
MEISVKTLNERIKEETGEYRKKIKYQKSCQEKIDFILSNEWLLTQEKTNVKVTVSTWIWPELTFHISNVPIDDFIENVLGPYHSHFDVLWKMTIDGDENEPVFEFHPIHEYRTKFRVKEGEFKVCKIVKDFVKYIEPSPPQAIYNTRLVCE